MRLPAPGPSFVGMNADTSSHRADRTAVITGASAGLGRALAERLAEAGWNLVLAARGEARLAEVAERLGARYLSGDLAYRPEHRRRLVELADGRIDLLVNNASTLGEVPMPRLAESDPDTWPATFELNLRAPFHLARLALPTLRERRGAIVNISSDAAVGPYPTWGVYGASKAALDQLSNVLGAEEPDVRVWSVDPGEMNTEMLSSAVGADEAGRASPPEHSAAAIARIIETRPESGRLLAADFTTEAAR